LGSVTAEVHRIWRSFECWLEYVWQAVFHRPPPNKAEHPRWPIASHATVERAHSLIIDINRLTVDDESAIRCLVTFHAGGIITNIPPAPLLYGLFRCKWDNAYLLHRMMFQ
jgi:hypothetical protein